MFHRPQTKEQMDAWQEKARARRAAADARKKRRVQMGYEQGEVRPNGVVVTTSPRGYVPLSTRELVRRVSERMDMEEAGTGRRTCPINRSHCLQIRGKDLRRLRKAMPGLRQEGRELVQEI